MDCVEAHLAADLAAAARAGEASSAGPAAESAVLAVSAGGAAPSGSPLRGGAVDATSTRCRCTTKGLESGRKASPCGARAARTSAAARASMVVAATTAPRQRLRLKLWIRGRAGECCELVWRLKQQVSSK